MGSRLTIANTSFSCGKIIRRLKTAQPVGMGTASFYAAPQSSTIQRHFYVCSEGLCSS